MPRELGSVLLNELEAAWRAAGAQIADVLAPGLSDERIDELMAPTGRRLPQEARRWWGWHNGVTEKAPYGWDIGRQVLFLSLEEALEESGETFGAGGEVAEPTWFPWVQAAGGFIAIDCADAEIASTLRLDYESGTYAGAASLGETVEIWLEMYSTGGWSMNSAGGYWDLDLDRAPERAMRLL
jgi:cell wall assembly regulator SMI1